MVKKNKSDMESDLKIKILLQAMKRYREIYQDLIKNGYIPIFAGQQATTVIITEYVMEHKDVLSSEDFAYIFFTLGSMKKSLEHNIKPSYTFDPIEFDISVSKYNTNFSGIKLK